MHSHYSRATSNKMDIENIERYGKLKGLNLIGAGDFTHPRWLKELKGNLQEVEGTGLYHYQDKDVFFMLSAEISLIYSQENKTRRIHHVLLAPSFEVVDQINHMLSNYGKLDVDGRPIFGKFPSFEMVDRMMQISKDIMIIPAHIWTPWYSLFGSMSGFNDIRDCFQDQLKNIHALETGMSSDPQMNWRISQIDKFTLISNSDSHSPWINRLGREANVFDTKMSYKDVTDAVRLGDKKKLLYTIETSPSWGKYHWDGHRDCKVSLSPKEARRYKNICPVCGKSLTIGVEHRVEDLADRQDGFVKENAIPFRTLLPLTELIAIFFNSQPYTKKVWDEANKMIEKFGSELNVLLDAHEEQLKLRTNENIVKLILRNREGKLKVQPGFDGVYGKLLLDEDVKSKQPQPSISSFIK